MKKVIDPKERKKLVLAMETVARAVNDEEVFERWLCAGVADGDLDDASTWEDVDDFYTEDENFKDLMTTFLRLMRDAGKSGGLYCDMICSDEIRKKVI